jgi:hypothetical protein
MTKEELREKYSECSKDLASRQRILTSMGYVNVAFKPAEEIDSLQLTRANLELEVAELQTKKDCYERSICKLVEVETEDSILSI